MIRCAHNHFDLNFLSHFSLIFHSSARYLPFDTRQNETVPMLMERRGIWCRHMSSRRKIYALLLFLVSAIILTFLNGFISTFKQKRCDIVSSNVLHRGKLENEGEALSGVSGQLFTGERVRSFSGQTQWPQPSTLKTSRTCSKWAVCTTIHSMTPAIYKISEKSDFCLVIVADHKTPIKEYMKMESKSFHFLSVEKQEAMNTMAIAHEIPWNHYGRKNIGYLYAIQQGANVVFDFDDDNELTSNIPSSTSIERSLWLIAGNTQVFNPYPTFVHLDDVAWPRGFPLTQIQNTSTWRVPSRVTNKVNLGVIQSLANDDPDMDAIWRLTRKLPLTFSEGKRIAIAPGTYSSYNAQATLHYALWALLLPVSVHGRVSDIWRSYIMQRLMHDVGQVIGFVSPFVQHVRTAHNYHGDYMSERPLYEKTEALIRFLSQWKGLSEKFDVRFVELFIAMYERGFIEAKDVILAQKWIITLKQLNYVFPEIERTRSIEKPSLMECKSAFFTPNISSVGGANTPNGGTFKFNCQTGYAPSGIATCKAGEWSSPTCELADPNLPTGNKTVFCLFGKPGHRQASASFMKHVKNIYGPADVIVVTDKEIEEFSYATIRVTQPQNLLSWFNKYYPSWKEWGVDYNRNYLGGLPGYTNGGGAYILRDRMICAQEIKKIEKRRSIKFKRLGFARLDLMWMGDAPVVSPHGCWIPCESNDWGGFCDHVAICSRSSLEALVMPLSPSVPLEKIQNIEALLKLSLRAKRVKVTRGHAAFFRSCRNGAAYNNCCQWIPRLGMTGKSSGFQLAPWLLEPVGPSVNMTGCLVSFPTGCESLLPKISKPSSGWNIIPLPIRQRCLKTYWKKMFDALCEKNDTQVIWRTVL